MKPTQLMLDAAYEAALVSTTEQLARNGSSVNYRVVMEAALTEALAVMPKPEEPKPEEPKPAAPEVAYSVSHTLNGVQWGGISGPYPKLSQALQQNGDDPNHYICKHELDGTINPLCRWDVDDNKWVRFTP